MSRVSPPILAVSEEPGPEPVGSVPELVGSFRGRVVAAIAGLNQRRLLVVVALLGLYLVGLVRPTDIDFWWHVKTGELIARSGSVPMFDPFAFSAVGRPWVAHEWLWELAVYEVTRLGGYGLATVVSGFVVLAVNLIIYRLLRALGVNELVAAALVLVAGILASPSVGVRPREFTQLFLAFYVSRLILYRMGKVRSLWSLPVVMAVWVNVHGPFVIGLVVLGVFVFGALVQYAGDWRRSRESARLPRHLLLVGLATFLVIGINPRGASMLLYPFSYYLARDNPVFATVTEWQSPNFHDPFYLIFAATLIPFLVVGSRKKKFDLVTSLLIVGFSVEALISVRNVAIYAPIAIPLLGERLSDAYAWARELKPLRSSPTRIAVNWILLATIILGGVAFTQHSVLATRLQLEATPRDDGLPVAAVNYIDRQNLPGPIFNNQGWGGYLIYRWYPERQVFIDGRVDMYGTAIVKDYLAVVEIHPNWRQVLDRYGIQTILIQKDSPLSTLLLEDPGWTRVYHDEVADIFVRK